MIRTSYRGALAASLLVHAGLIALSLLVTLQHDRSEGQMASQNLATVAVFQASPNVAAPQFERVEDQGLDEASTSIADVRFDLDKIARRRYLLFPLIGADVALEALAHTAKDYARRPLQNPLVRTVARTRAALSLNMEQVQRVVDSAWSRSERWNAFGEIATLVGRYDANDPTLALVIRKYVDENLLQPFDDLAVPDPSVWIGLRLAADFVDFLDFVTTYVAQNPGTKTATELLFLLDKLIQSNEECLTTLLHRQPEADLQLTRSANSTAFDLAAEIWDHYRRALATAGLSSPMEIARRYDSVRLIVLTAILETTPDGYRANDARFLTGTIHWTADRPDDAVLLWQRMRPDRSDTYYISATRVLDATATVPANAVRVKQALRDERGRSWMSSADRLRRFGYRPDRY